MTIHFPGNDDIVLGTTAPPFPFPQFRLSPEDQAHHATIWGRTGSGKSRLLESLFLQHLNKRHGVGLLEPHHDLSFDTLTYLIGKGFFKDDDAYRRLVYLDWGAGYVPFNVLAGDGDPEDIALNVFSAMVRVWPELNEAPLFKRLFLSSVVVLIANHLPLTPWLYQLLTDPEFRRGCLSRVGAALQADLERLIQDTLASYEKLGRDQMQAANSTLNRVFALSFNRATRLTLGQPDNWLPLRKWMDEGRSIIINLGHIGDEETKKLIGALLMVGIERAALSRTDLAPSHRTPFTLLVDEWDSFAAQGRTISNILSQTRKYNLRLYLAGQSLSQVSSDRLAGALENCRLTVVFGVGRGSAEIEAKQIGRADPFAIKEQALTLTQHSQYMAIGEQFESWTQELQNLSPRLAYAKLHDEPAARIKTLTVPDAKVDPDEVQEVLDTYKRRYQRTKEEAEEAIASLSSPASATPSTPPSSTAPVQKPAYTTLFQRPSS